MWQAGDTGRHYFHCKQSSKFLCRDSRTHGDPQDVEYQIIVQTSLTLEGAVWLVSAQLNFLYEENAQTNLMYFRPSYRKSLMYICTQNWILPGPIISYTHFCFITMPETFLVPGHVEELNFKIKKAGLGGLRSTAGKVLKRIKYG